MDVSKQKNPEKEFKRVSKHMESLVIIQTQQLKTTTIYHSLPLTKLTKSSHSNLMILLFGSGKALSDIAIKQYNFYQEPSTNILFYLFFIIYQYFKCTFPVSQPFYTYVQRCALTSVQFIELHFTFSSERLQNSKYPPQQVELINLCHTNTL